MPEVLLVGESRRDPSLASAVVAGRTRAASAGVAGGRKPSKEEDATPGGCFTRQNFGANAVRKTWWSLKIQGI